MELPSRFPWFSNVYALFHLLYHILFFCVCYICVCGYKYMGIFYESFGNELEPYSVTWLLSDKAGIWTQVIFTLSFLCPQYPAHTWFPGITSWVDQWPRLTCQSTSYLCVLARFVPVTPAGSRWCGRHREDFQRPPAGSLPRWVAPGFRLAAVPVSVVLLGTHTRWRWYSSGRQNPSLLPRPALARPSFNFAAFLPAFFSVRLWGKWLSIILPLCGWLAPEIFLLDCSSGPLGE